MTAPENFIAEEDLHAYVDGLLDESRRAEIEVALDQDGEFAARVNAYRAQNRALIDAFDPILDERVPERLIAAATRPRLSWWRQPQAAAAGIVLLLLGGALGWTARDYAPAPQVANVETPYTKYAVSAHKIYTREVRHAVEVAAKEEKHLVRWLSKRLGHPLKIPTLKTLGFDLVGGRLLATPDDAHAAQFMFQDEKGRRLTHYVRSTTAAEPTSFRFEKDGDSSMFYWIENPFAYALIGPVKREELSKLSLAVYEQIAQ